MSNSSEHVRVIVLGDSGVGKTTFCRMICAKDMPSEEARKATGSTRVLCRKMHDHVHSAVARRMDCGCQRSRALPFTSLTPAPPLPPRRSYLSI
jgi:ABC-type multidrug transport system ATPase subunit